MSGPILFGESIVRLPSARIARDDVAHLRDAADLLEQAKCIRNETHAASDTARAQGFEAGIAEARGEIASAIAGALSALTEEFAAENARREREVSAAAMEVVEQLIGAREPADIVTGLVTQALRKADAGRDPCTIEVAPDMMHPLREALTETQPELQIEANCALDPLGCRIVSGEGRIVADLSTQLATLRARWGLPQGDKT